MLGRSLMKARLPVGRDGCATAGLAPGIGTVRTILVVLLCPLGDTLFATPALRALRRRFPEAEITVLCWSSNEPLLRYNPHVNHVVACPSGLDLAVFPLRMLDRRFDLGVGLSHFGTWVTPFFRAAERIGFHVLDTRRLGRLYGRPVSDARNRHAIEYCLGVVAEVGARPDGLHMELYTGPAEKARARELLAPLRRPVVAMHAGADHFPAKRWPPERFAELAERLAARFGASVVLVGGPDDVPLSAEIARRVRAVPLLDLTGRLPLLETAAVLERVDLMIGNDSGPLHMAEAVGTPVVGLFGPSDPRNFAPLDPRHRIVVGTCNRGRRCIRWLNGPLRYLQATECRCEAMRTISVEAVLAAATELLAASR
ncbi:MAG TPA: glycosyltransferase family 9 protein [Thermaerobacter sp.]